MPDGDSSMREFAFIRPRHPSAVFNAAGGDVVRVTRDICEQLVTSGFVDSVPTQACDGWRYRPGSAAVDT